MENSDSIEEIFFKFLKSFEYDPSDLDYEKLEKHKVALQTLSEVGNSGITIFDISTCNTVFYSSNFGQLLGYSSEDYKDIGQMFFGNRIHPEDKHEMSRRGVSVFRMFDAFPVEDKLNYKVISEYRMLNANMNYVRLIEQYQVLELDKKGQIWLMMSFVELSPDQEDFNGIKSQFINFKTGELLGLKTEKKAKSELTKREMEILRLVKNGLLSKEISEKLAISLHTVNTHRQRLLEKLGANNSMEAILFASKFGLLD